MSRVIDVLSELEQIAPARYTFDFDRVGLQVGDSNAAVTRAIVSLDRSLAAIEHCCSVGAQLLVSHHPLLLRPLESVTEATYEARTARRLIESGISFIAAHTNWDSARGGINDALADLLQLTSVEDFGSGAMVASASGPFVEQPAGRVGTLSGPTTIEDFAKFIAENLEISPWIFGERGRIVQHVAVVGGAADGEWRAAQAAGADVLVTGEVKQHIGLEAMEAGFAIIAAGHYATEQPGVPWLKNRLAESLLDIEWSVFAPQAGSAGRSWSVQA